MEPSLRSEPEEKRLEQVSMFIWASGLIFQAKTVIGFNVERAINRPTGSISFQAHQD